MQLIKLQDASVEPLDLAAAITHLRLTYTDADINAEVSALITVARQACEERIGRSLIATSWRLSLPQLCAEIALPQGQILSVDAVRYTDTSGTTSTLSPTAYRLRESRVLPAYGTSWPGQTIETGAASIDFTAGYGAAASAVPKVAVQWIKLCLADLWTQRTRSAERPAVPQGFADSLLDTLRCWSL